MKEMGKVYWCHSMGAAGASLVAIFVPIFLLKSGYSFQNVLIYLLLQQIYASILQFPVSKLIAYISPHHLLVVGNLFYTVFFALLFTLHTYRWPLWMLSFAWALNRTTYWVAFHYTFGMARGHKNSGRQVAGINALNMLLTTAAPVIGGLIATFYGISFVYGAAIILMCVSIIPMLRSNAGPGKVDMRVSYRQFYIIRRDALANACNGMVLVAEQSIWPILVSLIITSYAGIGLLGSMIALASILVMLYVGRKQEKTGGKRFMRRGLSVYGIASFGRALAHSSTQAFGLNLLGGIGRSLYVIPFMNRYYTNSDGPERLGYITIMETSLSLGASAYVFGLLLLSFVLPVGTVLGIGLAIVAFVVAGVRLIR